MVLNLLLGWRKTSRRIFPAHIKPFQKSDFHGFFTRMAISDTKKWFLNIAVQLNAAVKKYFQYNSTAT
jgi:hypothetical protein